VAITEFVASLALLPTYKALIIAVLKTVLKTVLIKSTKHMLRLRLHCVSVFIRN